jgi:hypothetical protein
MVGDNEILNQQGKETNLKLAIVTELFDNGTAKIKFYGEESPSEKGYCYLASYQPTLDDTVVTVTIAGTYIILGKVKLQGDTPEKLITSEELEAKNYIDEAELGTVLEGYLTPVDLIDYVKKGEAQSNLTANLMIAKERFQAQGIFQHTGDYLSFFGAYEAPKQSVSNVSTTATAEEVRACLRNLVTVLHSYNLI